MPIEKRYIASNIKTNKDLDLRRKTDCTVIGYKDGYGEYIENSAAEQYLVPNSKIVVLGRPEQIQKLNSLYDIDEVVFRFNTIILKILIYF